MARCGHAASEMGREGRAMEACDTARPHGTAKAASTLVMGPRRQSWLGQNVWSIRQRHWESMPGHSVTSWLRRAASCGAAGVEQEQPSSRRSLANRVSAIRKLKNMHEASACYRAAGTSEKIASLDHQSLFTAQTWARWRHSNQGTVIRLRTAQAQPTDPNDKKHLLMRSGEFKWCWRRGARVERNSAPRLLLKTACSGATRTKEYERALSLPGKGQHPKRAVLKGRPTPISDEDWDKWHESHGSLFFCLRELSCS